MLRLLYLNPERFDYQHAQLVRGLHNNSSTFLTTLNLGNYGSLGTCLDGKLPNSIDALGEFDAILVGTSGRLGVIPDEWIRLSQDAKHCGRVVALIDSCDAGAIPLSRRNLNIFDIVFKRELTNIDNSVTNVGRTLLCPWWKKEFTAANACSIVRFPMTLAGSQRRPGIVPRRGWTTLGIQSLNVIGLPIGIEDRCIQDMNYEPRFEVSCTLTANTRERTEVLEFLAENLRDQVLLRVVKDESTNDLDLVASGAVSPRRTTDHKHLQSYFELLRHSRASISYPGGGFDTSRAWEILASGSLLISPSIPLEMPEPLEPWKHYVPFQGLTGLRDAVEFVWKNSSKADEIRQCGYKYAIEHHGEQAHALFVIQSIHRRISYVSDVA